MAEEDGFLRKVARFVAHPTTDWAELSSRQSERSELDKSELKAMVERKRRNDFVRRREFDMLRRMRREGLTPEQLAAIGTSTRLDDTGLALGDDPPAAAHGVTAKINDIEREMVGDPLDSSNSARLRPRTAPRAAPGEPGGPGPRPGAPGRQAAAFRTGDSWQATDPAPLYGPSPARAADPAHPGAAGHAGALASASTFAPEGPLPTVVSAYDSLAASSEVDAVHDPVLDEAVISFANADFDQCERALREMIAPGGPRESQAETWLVLFDLFRATGQGERFDALAFEYARRLGLSAPSWHSLPKAVSQAMHLEPQQPAPVGPVGPVGYGRVGWASPVALDGQAVALLRSQVIQLPQPWVLDWSGARGLDVEAATQLADLLRGWAAQPLEMRWIGTDNLLGLLSESASAGDRDVDPAFWMARLAILRVLNRADLFDETAIDYCMTYEVSPPAWEAPRCRTRQSTGGGVSVQTQPMSIISEVSTSFMESALFEEEVAQVQVASLELSGQLVGDIVETLQRLNGDIGTASIVNVSCARLIRVDFLAAGDLLNWVLSKRSENRSVRFVDTHRLVALFFVAMGINEHAGVSVRRE